MAPGFCLGPLAIFPGRSVAQKPPRLIPKRLASRVEVASLFLDKVFMVLPRLVRANPSMVTAPRPREIGCSLMLNSGIWRASRRSSPMSAYVRQWPAVSDIVATRRTEKSARARF